MRCLSGSILSLADMPQEFPDQIPFLFHPSFFPHSFFQTAGISKRKIHNSRLCHPFIILNGTDATLRRKQLQKIRVDEDSIHAQCRASHCEGRLSLPYHQMIPEKKLPCTIGGGIGQSRLCMLLLNKAHVGEVQASIWPDEMLRICEKHNIPLL